MAKNTLPDNIKNKLTKEEEREIKRCYGMYFDRKAHECNICPVGQQCERKAGRDGLTDFGHGETGKALRPDQIIFRFGANASDSG